MELPLMTSHLDALLDYALKRNAGFGRAIQAAN